MKQIDSTNTATTQLYMHVNIYESNIFDGPNKGGALQ